MQRKRFIERLGQALQEDNDDANPRHLAEVYPLPAPHRE
jgi:hypothetical protein